MEICVCICTRNHCGLLDRALSKLRELVIPSSVDRLSYLILDNGSTDPTPEVVERHSHFLPIRYEHVPEVGKSHALNRAREMVADDLTFFVDDDIVVTSMCLSHYMQAYADFPDAAFWGGPVFPLLDGEVPQWIARNLHHLQGPYSLLAFGGATTPISADNIPFVGGNSVVKTDVLRKYAFNVELGRRDGSLVGGEDTAYFRQLCRAGHFGVWVGNASVMHVIGQDKLNLKYISKWYKHSGITSAILNKDSLDELGPNRLVFTKISGAMDSFFAGPLWLKAVKVYNFYSGFTEWTRTRLVP